MIQHRCKRYFVYLVVILSCALVFFNEFLIYSIYRLSWSSIHCRTGNCTTVLLVADPQIIGETFDTNFYSSIAIHDSDHYLKNTFVRAMAFAKPDVVCFMGDLMDEGSVANEDAFQRYLKRFNYLFKTSANVLHIHIPGDNDIGGEGGDFVTPAKLTRFRESFNESRSVVVHNQFRFLNINLLTHAYPEADNSGSEATKGLINIVLTHISVLSYPGLTMKMIFDKFKPNIIFSAHTHLSRVLTYPPQEVQSFSDNRIVKVDLRTDNAAGEYRKHTEIMIPTSSYRMGVYSIGYGFAVIDSDELQYTVLWSPNRFICLGCYAVWFGFLIICLFSWLICQNAYFCKRRVTYRFRLMIATDKF